MSGFYEVTAASVDGGWRKIPTRTLNGQPFQESSRCRPPLSAKLVWDSFGCWFTEPEGEIGSAVVSEFVDVEQGPVEEDAAGRGAQGAVGELGFSSGGGALSGGGAVPERGGEGGRGGVRGT